MLLEIYQTVSLYFLFLLFDGADPIMTAASFTAPVEALRHSTTQEFGFVQSLWLVLLLNEANSILDVGSFHRAVQALSYSTIPPPKHVRTTSTSIILYRRS